MHRTIASESSYASVKSELSYVVSSQPGFCLKKISLQRKCKLKKLWSEIPISVVIYDGIPWEVPIDHMPENFLRAAKSSN